MTQQFSSAIAITVLLLSVVSCRPKKPHNAFVPVNVQLSNGKVIGGGMTDSEILTAFDVPNAAKREWVQGKDGTSTTYANERQTITITRSAVTGVYVTATGQIQGDWRLSASR